MQKQSRDVECGRVRQLHPPADYKGDRKIPPPLTPRSLGFRSYRLAARHHTAIGADRAATNPPAEQPESEAKAESCPPALALWQPYPPAANRSRRSPIPSARHRNLPQDKGRTNPPIRAPALLHPRLIPLP